jgi:menaquinone-dependent protoporphyrinogen oxidase
MSAAGGREDDRLLAQGYVDAFLQETGWTPDMTELVAGALSMGTQGPGGDGGSSWDYEYTDWDAAAQFARRFAASLD